MHLAPEAHSATDGGTFPGQLPATVAFDLLVGPPVTDTMLARQFKSSRPLQTEKLLARIPAVTTASNSLAALRANIIRVATRYMEAPTLEDKGSNNRSKLICALGTAESCAQRWPWCAIFASSVWRMAGIRAMPLTPPVSGIVAWGKAHGRWRDLSSRAYRRFKPSAGDLVAYGCDRKRDYCDHTGIVVGATAMTIETIEGNTSTLVRGRDGVAAKVRPRSSWISGYVSLS